MRSRSRFVLVVLALLLTATSSLAGTYTVMNTNDTGAGSFRQGILDANSATCADPCTIDFLPATFAAATQTISLTAFPFPAITANNVFIDGFSGGTVGAMNTNPFGSPDNSVQRVVINGISNTCCPIVVNGTNFRIRGVVLQDFITALQIQGTGATITGSKIGTDAAGTAPSSPPNVTGIQITATGSATIGGTAPADRNLISGQSTGIQLQSAGNLVIGNYIGTNAAGTGAILNGVGIEVAAGNNTIGNATIGNVISGNSGQGVTITTGTGTTLSNNRIGTTVNGMAALPNGNVGVRVGGGASPGGTTIGGSGLGNLISGNLHGIEIANSNGNNNISFNVIGLNIALSGAIGNGGNGIFFNGGGSNNVVTSNSIGGNSGHGILLFGPTNTTIQNNSIGYVAGTPRTNFGGGIWVSAAGGTTTITQNIIRNNGGIGVDVDNANIGVAIKQNQMADNGGIGIDLHNTSGSLGPTPNDPGDADSGAGNHLQNFPAITSAAVNGTTGAATLTLRFNIDSASVSTTLGLRAEAFIADTDPSFPEGLTFLQGQCFAGNNLSNATMTIPSAGVTPGSRIVMTATSYADGTCTGVNEGTSEFSPAAIVTVQPGLVVNTNDSGAGSLRQAINDANSGACVSPCVITFNIPMADPGFVGGVFTIQPTSLLPNILADNTVLDGATQTAFTGDTNVNGPEIVINGALAGAGVRGLGIGAASAGQGQNIVIQHVVVNGFTSSGISISGATFSVNNAQIRNNYVGTSADGMSAVPNGGDGIFVGISANAAQIGATGAGNLISGNTGRGVELINTGTLHTIRGNKIGTNRTGAAGLPNGGAGILISQTSTATVGGTGAGQANTIAHNGGAGVSLTGGGANNSIRGNSIHSNTTLGIDLLADLVTLNDAGDPDTGPNALQNFPVLTLASYNSGLNQTTFTGNLNSIASTAFDIDWYSNATLDGSGHGEGQTYLGTSTFSTDGTGNTPVSIVLPGNLTNANVVATASRVSGADRETSEFSALAPNNPPTANPDAITSPEDGSGSVNVLTNDTDPDGPSPMTVIGSTNGAFGSVICTGAGLCTYTPNPNTNGSDSFTYTVSDGAATSIGTVNVTVNAVNDPPVAVNDAPPSTLEDTATTFDPRTNDTDIDGPSPITITGNSAPSSGTATCTATSCTYTPAPNFFGTATFTYTITDGAAPATATVTVTVTATNDAPVATDDSASAASGVPVAINVIANDTDVEGNPLTVSPGTPPANGSVSCSGATCTYLSNAGFTGTDVFTYNVSDGAGGTDSGAVTVTVTSSNAPPNAVDDSATTLQGRPVAIRVLQNDSDPNGDTITILSWTQGTKGSVNCIGNVCSYTPNAGATGADFFTYTIKDPSLATDTATVTINIIPCPAEIVIFSPVDGATNVPTSGNLSFAGAASEHLVYFGPAGTGCATEFALTGGSSVAYSGLNAGQQYEWRVEGRQPGCPRNTSACVRFTTAGSCPAPPTLLTPANGATATSPVTFSWTAVPGATNYRVFISVNSGPSNEIGATAGTSTSLTVPDGSISWHVVATVTGCGDLRSPVSAFNACSVPGQPLASVVGESTSEQTYVVSWDFMASASHYEVQEATNDGFTDATTTIANGTAVSFTKISNVAAPFFYRVRAFSECAGMFGPYSPTIRVVVVPVPPADDPNTNASVPAGSQRPVVMQIFVAGTPDQTHTFTARTDQPWAHVEPDHGSLPPEGVTLNVTADPTGLPNGTFTGTVIVTIDDGLGGSRQVTTGTTTKQVPVSINLVTPVVPLGAGTPNDSSMIIPVVGHLDGSDARWRSDVRLANTGDERLRYQLTFVPADITIGMKQTTVEVAAGDTTALDDIVRAWYGVGSLGESSAGYLEVRPLVTNQQGNGTDVPKATASTVLTSRTYSQTSNGTVGEFIPGIRFGNFIGRLAGSDATQKVLSLQQIAQNESFRTNVGLVEASGQAVSAVLSIFNAGGTKLADVPIELRANEQRQLNSMLATEGITSLSDGRIEVRVASGEGKVIAYASVVDNRSKDQLFVPAVTLRDTQSSKYVVAGVADLVSGSANWRSDLRIFNASADTQSATLTLHPQNNSGSPITANVTILPGEVRLLDNVVQNTFGATNLGGAVHVTTPTDSSLVVTGRTYHQTSNGNLGQFIEAVTPDEAIGNGERSLNILQAEDSVRFRTNVGIAEVSGNPATVEITVSFPDSKVAPIIRVPLAANEFRQIGLLRQLNLGNVYNARISVRVVEGGGRITAYGSLIDMRTQDSTYVPAR